MAKNWVMAPFNHSERPRFDQVWKYDRENSVISIGWDLGEFRSREELQNKYRERIERNGWTKAGLTQLIRLWFDIKLGDRIIARGGTRKIVGVGTVTGAPFYSPEMKVTQGGDVFESDHGYFLPVNWKDFEREFPSNKFSRHTLYSVSDDGFHALVDGRSSTSGSWEEFIERAKAYVDTGRLESKEIEYKVEIGQALSAARQAVMTGASDWADLIRSGVVKNHNYLVHFTQLDNLRKWVEGSEGEALNALRVIWSESDSSVSDRIRAFSEQFPRSVTSGPGTRANVISLLLMGLDVWRFPPFHITVFDSAFDQTGWGKLERGADEATLYEYALGFLDLFIEKAAKRGLTLRHRLDAQSVVWALRDGAGGMLYEEEEGDYPKEREVDDQEPREGEESPSPYDIGNIISDGCFLDRATLESMLQGLQAKRNMILQGPPGTGKTWLAKKLAYALIGQKDEDKVRQVQFHPNLSYEDFVRGFRPQSDGKLGLVNGPFLELSEVARRDSSGTYVMVIEEINRGNPASIFGELLTLLEADKRMSDNALTLAYQHDASERFHIPPNLYVIGTMNLADRSLALVDFALRRRFAFFDLEPALNDTWRDWVHRQCEIPTDFLTDVSRRIDALNNQISDDPNLGRQFRIGHSFIVPKPGEPIAVPEEWFMQVVETEIAPLLREYWFNDSDKADEARSQLLSGL